MCFYLQAVAIKSETKAPTASRDDAEKNKPSTKNFADPDNTVPEFHNTLVPHLIIEATLMRKEWSSTNREFDPWGRPTCKDTLALWNQYVKPKTASMQVVEEGGPILYVVSKVLPIAAWVANYPIPGPRACIHLERRYR